MSESLSVTALSGRSAGGAPAAGASIPQATVRETGTGPFRCVVVDVPAGVHPASLATVLRSLPIACEFLDAAVALTGTGSGSELRFRVHEAHGGVGVPRLDEISPSVVAEGPSGGVR